MESEHILYHYTYYPPDEDDEIDIKDYSFSFSLEGIPAPSPVSCPNPLTITDVDGNTYHTVQIGNQCWMKENLRTTKYADGTSITQGSIYDSGSAYWYYPNGESSYKPTHGLLYNREAVMRNSNPSNANPSGVQGICPTGWHVPSYAEWMQLIDYVRSQRWYVCECCPNYIGKAMASTWGWSDYNSWNPGDADCQVGNTQSNNNATGFSAMPAGNFLAYYFSGTQYYRYERIGTGAIFWTTATNDAPYSSQIGTYNSSSSFGASSSAPVSGCSVRCLKN
ncbi:MAG: fibrobacter succinogenes major paralogous domain-containing protein [Bacteroidales bacterium]|nr:fibrobacter succinogenes major paralogous domain-containing protein [Bacteroidales bacterium]